MEGAHNQNGGFGKTATKSFRRRVARRLKFVPGGVCLIVCYTKRSCGLSNHYVEAAQSRTMSRVHSIQHTVYTAGKHSKKTTASPGRRPPRFTTPARLATLFTVQKTILPFHRRSNTALFMVTGYRAVRNNYTVYRRKRSA